MQNSLQFILKIFGNFENLDFFILISSISETPSISERTGLVSRGGKSVARTEMLIPPPLLERMAFAAAELQGAWPLQRDILLGEASYQ